MEAGKRIVVVIALALVGLLNCGTSAHPGMDDPVTLVVAPIDTATAAPGDTALVMVPLRITPGYHVNANPASSEDYIPIEARLDSSAEFHALKPEYPNGKAHTLEGGDDTLLVYNGSVTIPMPIVVDKDVKHGMHRLEGTIEFQACDDRVCFMPEERHFSAVIRIP